MQTNNRVKTLQCLFVLLCSWALASCTSLPPTQEMSDARQAVQAARQAGAADLVPELMQAAEQRLQAAEEALQARHYYQAREAANHAHSTAIRAYEKARENTN
jgi:hypothetical protein